MWTCAQRTYGQAYGWMPNRVGLSGDEVSQSQGGYTPPNNPDDPAIKKAKDAAKVAVDKWAAAYKHAMTFHTDYAPALKANSAAQKAEDAWATAALAGLNTLNLNYADQGGAPKSLTQPYSDAYAAAQQQHKFLVDGRAFLVADMAAHLNLGIGQTPAQEEAAAAQGDALLPKPVGTPPPPVSVGDAEDPTKPAPPPDGALAAPLEWGMIAGWGAVVLAGGWIFWRVVTGRGLA